MKDGSRTGTMQMKENVFLGFGCLLLPSLTSVRISVSGVRVRVAGLALNLNRMNWQNTVGSSLLTSGKIFC